MAVMRVSSSEFRVKMKDMANAIAEEQHRVIVTRHGGPMMIVIGEEDYEFLLKHKPRPTPRVVPDPVPDILEKDPDELESAEIQRICKAIEEIDEPRFNWWRRRAIQELGMRRHYEAVRSRPPDEGRDLEVEPAATATRAPAAPAAWAALPALDPLPEAAVSPPSRTGPPPARS